ncbi:MAG: DUF3488 and transglutaminase-like domain-containing protein [Halobacteriovoraceae bacterium]|nr:DUF3488 and transglutaminase-like domain-containing protein [Halobacteriovoraceae bacterium]
MSLLYKFCMAFLVLSYLPFVNQVSPTINAALFLNFTLSFWQESGKRKVPGIIRLGLMASGIALIYSEYKTLWGLEPGVATLSLLATLKIFELEGKRDFFLFVLIVELSLIGHVLTVDDLYMVLYIVFLSLSLFALLFSFYTGEAQIKWGKERRRVFINIFLTSLPLAGFLFFLFPRLTLGNLFFNTVKKVNYTGFSEEIKPGTISQVIQNPNPFFRAKFLEDKTPSNFELYWRGAILNKTLDGMTWKRAKPRSGREEIYSGPIKYKYEVTYDIFMNSPLFLLDNTIEFERSSKGYLLEMGGGTYKFYPYSNQKISYSGSTGKSRPIGLNENQIDFYLQLPDDKYISRFKEWARSIPSGSVNRLGKVFSKYLKEKEFTYTLAPGLLSNEAPLDQFFFDSKNGFCEHFSAAFATFLRLKGIPARVVVGFHGGEFNPLGQYYVVKGMDAHAWVEAWSKKKGWVRVDPTSWVSPDRIRYGSVSYFLSDNQRETISMDVYLEQRNNEFWQGLKFALDMLYYEANREFIGFDLNKQENLFSFLGTKGKRWPWKLLALCLIISSAFGLPLYFRLKKVEQNYGKEFYWYSLLLKKLKKAGLAIDSWYGPEKVEELACENFPTQKVELKRAFQLFVKCGYGNGQASEFSEFRSVVKALRIPKVRGNSQGKAL